MHGVFKELRGLVNIKWDVIVSDFEAALWRATREIFLGAVHPRIKKDQKVCRRNVCRRNVRTPSIRRLATKLVKVCRKQDGRPAGSRRKRQKLRAVLCLDCKFGVQFTQFCNKMPVKLFLHSAGNLERRCEEECWLRKVSTFFLLRMTPYPLFVCQQQAAEASYSGRPSVR